MKENFRFRSVRMSVKTLAGNQWEIMDKKIEKPSLKFLKYQRANSH